MTRTPNSAQAAATWRICSELSTEHGPAMMVTGPSRSIAPTADALTMASPS
jgi:hypothetical protein